MLNSGVPLIRKLAGPGCKTPHLPANISPKWTASFQAMSTLLDAY